MAKIVFDKDEIIKSVIDAMTGLGIDMVEMLQLKSPEATGYLKDNIDFKTDKQGSEVSLTISLPFYAKFVEYGTPPHMPPVEDIREWLIAKGMDPELAWPIAIEMKNRGTRPQPFIRPVINNHLIKLLKKNLKKSFK